MRISFSTLVGLLVAFLSGVIAFLGGIFRLGEKYLTIPALVPTTFNVFHPYMMVFAFFTLLIILERYVGLGNLPDRPKVLTDVPIIFAELASISFIMNVISATYNSSLTSTFLNTAFVLEFIAIAWFIGSQLWLYKNYSSTRPPVLLAIYAFILLEAILVGLIVNLPMSHEYIYMVLYLAILILGERLDLAQVGIRRSARISLYPFLLLGAAFIISIVLNTLFSQLITFPVTVIILGIFTFLLIYIYTLIKTSLGSFLLLGTFILAGALLDLFYFQILIFQIILLILLFFIVLLLRYDIAVYKVPEETLISYYLRWSLRGGYLWLVLGIVLMELYTFNQSFYLYDSALHSIALGFIMTMVFSHAPIVFPSVVRAPFIEKFRGNLYWVVAFWILIAIRIIGDLITMIAPLEIITMLIGISGFFNIPILLGFLFSINEAILKGNTKVQAKG